MNDEKQLEQLTKIGKRTTRNFMRVSWAMAALTPVAEKVGRDMFNLRVSIWRAYRAAGMPNGSTDAALEGWLSDLLEE